MITRQSYDARQRAINAVRDLRGCDTFDLIATLLAKVERARAVMGAA